MYVSIKDNLPKKLIIYDNKSKERIIYTYENFNWAVKIEDKEF
jgi:outer membrane lipoprotein-sorting protein